MFRAFRGYRCQHCWFILHIYWALPPVFTVPVEISHAINNQATMIMDVRELVACVERIYIKQYLAACHMISEKNKQETAMIRSDNLV